MKGLFLLELDSVKPDELDNAHPLISLNAILSSPWRQPAVCTFSRITSQASRSR
jgi:hypothetical protein